MSVGHGGFFHGGGNRAAINEPAPTPSVGCIQDLVAADVREGVVSKFKDEILADIEARKQLGIKKYGTALQAHNGRNARMDAYQEVLDLLMYLRQDIEEQGGVDAVPTVESADDYEVALVIAVRLRSMLG